MLIILCGKSASGKDRIEKEMLKNENVRAVVSTTSRPMREGEREGIEYHFVSSDQFKKQIENNNFIEYRQYDTCVQGKKETWYYGTSKEDLDDSLTYVAIKDLEGAKTLKNYYEQQGNACVIFYVDADKDIRTERASRRGSFDQREWDRRLVADEIDFSADKIEDACDIKISNNGTKTLEEITSEIIDIARSKEKELLADSFYEL